MASTYTFTQITGGSAKFKVGTGPSHVIEDSDYLDQLGSTIIRMQGHTGTYDMDTAVDTIIIGGTTYGPGSNIDTVFDALNPLFKKANTVTGGTVSGISDVPGLTAALATKTANFTPTGIKTAAYTAAANELVKTDATSATVPITLPPSQPDKTRVAVKMIAVSGSFTTTILTGGTDVFNKSGGATSVSLSLLNQAVTFQYESTGGIWSVVSSDVPLTQLDLRFGTLQVQAAHTTQLASLPTPYLGQVATRCFLPLGKYSAATGQWIQYRSMHWSRDSMVNPTLVFPHFTTSSANVETLVAGGTIKAAIEYPLGTYTLANECIANGNAAVACGTGLTVLTFNITIPNNAQFWVRAYEINDNGPAYTAYQNNGGSYNQPLTEGFESGTAAITDKTTSGTIPFGGGFAKTPILILAKTIRPSCLLVGDSRLAGGNEVLTDQSGDVGELSRSIGPFCGYTNFGIASSRLSTYNSASRTYRDMIANGTITGINSGVPYFTHIINQHAINDLQGGDSAATCAGRHTTFAALYPNHVVIGTTATPNVASTDGWATKTNQDPTISSSVKVIAYNNLVRAGISGEKFYFDLSDGIDPFRSGKLPVTRNQNDTARATACTFTGSISGTTLTVTAVASGTISLFDPITDNLTAYPSIVTSTIITAFGTGTGGTGTYTINNSQTKTSRTIYVGGFATNDGLHMNSVASEMIRDSGVIKLSLIKR